MWTYGSLVSSVVASHVWGQWVRTPAGSDFAFNFHQRLRIQKLRSRGSLEDAVKTYVYVKSGVARKKTLSANWPQRNAVVISNT